MGGMLNREMLLIVGFVLVPFSIFNAGILHEGHRIALVVYGLAFLATRIENPWLRGTALYLVAWQLVISVLNLTGRAPKMFVAMAFDQYVYFILAAVVFVTVKDSKLDKEWFYNAICGTAVVQALIAVGQVQLGFDLFTMGLNYVVDAVSLFDGYNGTLGNPDFLCAYLAISLPLFFRRRWCWFLPLIGFVLFKAMVSAAFLAAAVAVALYLQLPVTRRNLLLYAGIGGVAAFYMLVLDDNVIHCDRWGIWWDAILTMAMSWPVFLVGMGTGVGFQHAYPLHNEWLTIFYRYGLAGLSLVAGFVLTAYRGNRELWACFGAVCVNMLGNYPLHLAPTVFLIVIIIALMERERLAEAAG